MEWKFQDDMPIYQQIMDRLKQGIAVGELKAGQRLPSVRELALEAGVNPNTMQKALAEMEREGLLYSQRTSGRFVAEGEQVTKKLQEEMVKEYVEQFIQKMRKLGYGPEETVELLHRYDEKFSGNEKKGGE